MDDRSAPPEEDIMGWVRYRHSEPSKKWRPGARERVEARRKRFQCDLFEFWRQCGNRCFKQRSCVGDPHDCFRRHHAALPRDDANWRQAEVLLGTTGTGTAEQALSAFNLSMPAKVRPECIVPPPPRQAGSREADAAVPAVDPAPEDDASRSARIAAAMPWKSSSEFIADMEKILGMCLTDKVEPQQAATSPSRQADAGAQVVVSQRTIPVSPDTGSTEPTLPAAGPSPPPAWRWTGPLNPPQATCDEQGRLIMPDRTEYNERIRRGMGWGEVYKG
jgi:hypothetical protein